MKEDEESCRLRDNYHKSKHGQAWLHHIWDHSLDSLKSHKHLHWAQLFISIGVKSFKGALQLNKRFRRSQAHPEAEITIGRMVLAGVHLPIPIAVMLPHNLTDMKFKHIVVDIRIPP